MFTCLKRITSMLALPAALLLIQSCSAPQQAVKPGPPVAEPQQVVKPEYPAADPNEITVFYDSDPPGAVLYEIGKSDKLGETPFWATYRLSDKELQEGVILLDPSRVVWPSGATASNHPGVLFDLKKGRGQAYIFKRPDVPGAEVDYEAGLKKLMHRITNGEGGSKSTTTE